MVLWSLNYRTDTIKLGKRIGHGAQAEVFKAQYGLDEVVVKRFLDTTHKCTKQEVDIIKRLTHRNIVQFYHVHHDMIVMEYVEGGDLAAVIVGKALKNWEVKTQIAKDISLGLAYLHDQGIIHCDIKSSNILLTEHKDARLCDFGHAIRVGENGGGGTLQWMAPELLQDPPLYTSKSDVYALGMVMWEMASDSTRPYREHTPDGMVYCILNSILEECPATTPKDYADCIQLCWKRQPEERPAVVDLLLDIVPSTHRQGEPEQQRRSAGIEGDNIYYLKALQKQYFNKSDSSGFMEIPKIDDKTFDWFNTRQCEAGVPAAMLKISEMYKRGRGVEQDDREAASRYQQAVEAVEEQRKLNNRFLHHEACVTEHHQKTMEWFNSATGSGAASAELNIGIMYRKGKGLKRDYKRAMDRLVKASDAGNNTAMVRIGIMYSTCRGVERDYVKAVEWFVKASEAGNAYAMMRVGFLYLTGRGDEKDYSKAMDWLVKASDAGNSSAMACIGVMSSMGRGVERDYVKAVEWYV
ncbi:hypothetical protein BGZ67_000293 [Mortierella alpina]|nr:hypothetical protein BGZ67_000293 [Mortierella alpina]